MWEWELGYDGGADDLQRGLGVRVLERVAFRADASFRIGTGHVMRCLTLAEAIGKKGVRCLFLCREQPGNLIDYIAKRGFEVVALAGPSGSFVDTDPDLPAHSEWLGASRRDDAAECVPALKEFSPDLLVIDHYGIDSLWEKLAAGCFDKLMVIDDLADRKHLCDLLLDQNFGRKAGDYNGLVPSQCRVTAGSRFALLRPEFSEWRNVSLKRRASSRLESLLISLGGSDPDNVTGCVLEELNSLEIASNLKIKVVLGPASPNIDAVTRSAESMGGRAEVLVNISNFAEVLAAADLAIGASGATTWERACLGLPAIQVVIASNQALSARALSEIGATGFIEQLTTRSLSTALADAASRQTKRSVISSLLVDGKGCERVVAAVDRLSAESEQGNEPIVQPREIWLKAAAPQDLDFVFELQGQDGVRRFSRNSQLPGYQEHCSWFRKIHDSVDRILFLVMEEDSPAGILRLDEINSDQIEVSIAVQPEFRGRGIASRAFEEVFRSMPNRRFKAVINIRNKASVKLFEGLGFKHSFNEGEFGAWFLRT